MTEKALREKTCCFTGHRNILADHESCLWDLTQRAVIRLVKRGYLYFIAGGALGFDTLAAEVVLALRDMGYPEIKLILAIPCEGQAAAWSAENVKKYERIRADADEVRVLAPRYYDGCMQARNRYMVDRASVCIAYLTETRGGTAGTVRYAEKQGIPVINLADAL